MIDIDNDQVKDCVDLYLHSADTNSREMNIIDNTLELFLQEIEIAVKIAPGEIWGIYESININRYVFNQYVTLSQVKNELVSYIQRNCHHASKYPWVIDAQFLNIDGKSILYIIVQITRVNDVGISENFFQKFLLGS